MIDEETDQHDTPIERWDVVIKEARSRDSRVRQVVGQETEQNPALRGCVPICLYIRESRLRTSREKQLLPIVALGQVVVLVDDADDVYEVAQQQEG